MVVAISDASFCQEQEHIDGVTQNFKSQQACVTALALGNALDAEKKLIHQLSWSSMRISRVCRSTLMVEASALSDAVEHGLRDKATIFDMKGELNIRQLEETASVAMGHVWFCRLRKPLFSFHIPEYQTNRQQTFGDRFFSPETTHLGSRWIKGRLSSLDRYVRDAGRLLNEDDDFWPIE